MKLEKIRCIKKEPQNVDVSTKTAQFVAYLILPKNSQKSNFVEEIRLTKYKIYMYNISV